MSQSPLQGGVLPPTPSGANEVSAPRGLSRRALLAGTGLLMLGAAVARSAGGSIHGARSAGHGRTTRWALLLDLDACARRDGCRACIDACHTAHRVETAPEARHRVQWLRKEPFARVFPERVYPALSAARRALPVVVTCNHCERAPCTSVCPTGATFRRPDGVVAMDPHRCIGCRYCMAACPYGARSFNWSTPAAPIGPADYPARDAGVVEKCTLCADRIDVGAEPRCVAACGRDGGGALRFGDVADPRSELRRLLERRVAARRRPELGTEPHFFYLG